MTQHMKEYFDSIEEITDCEGTYFPIHDEEDKPSGIVIATYENIPEASHKTFFSYGLSIAQHQEWKSSTPELLLSVKSDEDDWGLAMGEVILQSRSKSLFSVGTVVDFKAKISSDSDMSAFFIYFNCLLEREASYIRIPGIMPIFLQQMYPIYASEIDLFNEIGPQKFFTLPDVDFFDVRREPQS